MREIADTINSHIQMPKLLLKRFENKNHCFYYYDVKKGVIGSNGHAKSLNTELGYYSAEVEEYLNNYVETPLSDLLSQIDCINFDASSFDMPPKIAVLIRRFIYSLIARSPKMIPEIKKKSIYYQFLAPQAQHDYAVCEGMSIAENMGILNDWFVTFAVNKTTTPFVLPMFGIYNFKYESVDMALLPISPYKSILLVKNDGLRLFLHDGILSMILIVDDAQMDWFNEQAFSVQFSAGYGYVVSPDKASLIKCVKQKTNKI